ncbi:hypothetical protein [Streptococcus dysgalactiae]|uniref:Uncharacterized protein n=1 Tax=Streptococcus dysgalactiae TaxID=1334 RepID=A0A9X9SHN0_STRDY|nr:hypothetical protein [Streptococcus dysgalactiae]VTS19695.1 Uncharacterised protein [Streptococcus dysgalactiae subsp. equisimilis]VTS45007.1 Uncharacterised protein [Streptococcus dysgalactiae subsp. equisimilis]VTS77072.1 Uncharacterised protein [Streptococcus dysgalactiae]
MNGSNLQKELFGLAEQLKKSDLSNEILNVYKEICEEGHQSIHLTNSKQSESHFYGTLLSSYLCETNKNKSLPLNFLKPLNGKQIKIFTKGNNLIYLLVDSLLAELNFLPINTINALKPYTNYKKIPYKYLPKVKSEITSEKYDKISQQFSVIPAVQAINNRENFPDFETKQVLNMFQIISNQEIEVGYGNPSQELQTVIKKKRSKLDLSPSEELMDYIFTLYTIKKTISVILTFTYYALLQRELSVVDNRTLINVKGPSMNHLSEKWCFWMNASEKKSLNIGTISLATFNRMGENRKFFFIPYEMQTQLSTEREKIKALTLDCHLNQFSSYFN